MPTPVIKVTPHSLSFDTATSSLRIKNTGSADLVVHSIAFRWQTDANVFHLPTPTPFTVHPGGEHTVGVTCSAPDGISEAGLDIKSNAGEVHVAVQHQGNISPQTDGGHHRGGQSSGPGTGCFTASTLVLMADGTTRPIESLIVGDAIMTIAEHDEEPAPARIDAVLRHDTPHALFEVDGIRTTAPHRWAVVRAGDRAFVRTTALAKNERLLTCGARDGRFAQVVELEETAPVVFNLETSAHTFAVGTRPDGPFYVVHNAKDRKPPLNDEFKDKDP